MTLSFLFHSRKRSTFAGMVIKMGTYKRGRYTKVRPGEKIPNKPGAERWVSKKTGKVVYQGESSNIGNRIAQQKRDKMPYTRGNYEAQYKVADGRSTSTPVVNMRKRKSLNTTRDSIKARAVKAEEQMVEAVEGPMPDNEAQCPFAQ